MITILFEQSKIGDFTSENQLIDMSQIAVLSGSLVVVAALIYEGMQFKGMKMMLLHRTNLYIIAVFRSLTSKEVCQSNCPGKSFQQYIKGFFLELLASCNLLQIQEHPA